jgi:hypothetical protein
LRELVDMATARRRAAWDHTSAILWIQAEINRDKKKRSRPFRPEDFHPLRGRKVKEDIRIEKAPITVLRDVFIDGKLPDLVGKQEGGE